MSNETRKPTHRLVRYYGKGAKAARADIGAVWANTDGSLSIRIDSIDSQIWLNAFPMLEQGEA